MDNETNPERCLCQTLLAEFYQFEEYCRSINWIDILETYGTQHYYCLLENKTLNQDCLKVNPRYFVPLFDVIRWWRCDGKRRFPLLAPGALVILAKPSHNGHQECFFIGIFVNQKHQKKRDPRHYEMDVLCRINRDMFLEDGFYEQRKSQSCDDTTVAEKVFLKTFFRTTKALKNCHSSQQNVASTETYQRHDDDDETSVDLSFTIADGECEEEETSQSNGMHDPLFSDSDNDDN